MVSDLTVAFVYHCGVLLQTLNSIEAFLHRVKVINNNHFQLVVCSKRQNVIKKNKGLSNCACCRLKLISMLWAEALPALANQHHQPIKV